MSRLSPTFGRFLGRQPCPPNFSRNDPLYAIKLPSVSPKDPFPRAYVDTSLDEISSRDRKKSVRNLSFKRRERSVGTSREVVLLKIDGGNKETPARASEKKSIYLSLSFSRRIIIAFCKFFKNIIVEEIGNRKGRQREI